jgi:hypothetical protein
MDPERTFRIGEISRLSELSVELQDISENFVLFLALDALGITDAELRDAARKLIDRGLAYVCIWGNECERVHDCFDLERAPDEPSGATVMTTWHTDEPVEESLWFFANNAFPDESFVPSCKDWIAIAVGNSISLDRIRNILAS